MREETTEVHKHVILRNADPACGMKLLYWQVAVLEESSLYRLEFMVVTWKGDEIRDYSSMIQGSPGSMTFIMHPTLSSAMAEAEKIVAEAIQSGRWEIERLN